MSSSARLPLPDYEPRDARPGGIVITGGIIVLGVLGTLAVSHWLIATHSGFGTDRPAGPDAIFQHGSAARTSVQQDWIAQDRQVREHLTTYGWVDREHQIVRLPIERAMELTAQEAAQAKR